MVQDQRVWVFGDQVAQVFFDNSANDPENPFVQDFSGVMQQGTAAPASVTSFDNTLGWIGRSVSGQGIAWRNNGYTPQRISTFAVENAWRKYSTIEDAVGYSVIVKGHTFWRIWFPTARETWQYDASLPPPLAWTKILYYNPTGGHYEADRGSCACELGGKILVGDRDLALIYELSLDAQTDNGDRIRWMRRAPIISEENKVIFYPTIEFDMQVGVGDGSNGDPNLGPVTPEFDPQVMFRYSNDWAQTWCNERFASMGKQGEYSKRIRFIGNGSRRQRVLELSGTAAVPTVINNCYLPDADVGES